MSGGNASSNTDIMANDHFPDACFGIEATKQIYNFEEGKPHAPHFLYRLGDGDDRLETSPFQGSDNQEMYRITHEHLEEKKGMLENTATDGKRLEYMSRHLAPRAAAYERTGMAHVKDEDEKHRYVRQHDVELRPAGMISFCKTPQDNPQRMSSPNRPSGNINTSLDDPDRDLFRNHKSLYPAAQKTDIATSKGSNKGK